MFKEDKKKTIAAINAAICSYLQLEEQQSSGQELPQSISPERPYPVPRFSPWLQAGRQAMMERNYQIQFRFCR